MEQEILNQKSQSSPYLKKMIDDCTKKKTSTSFLEKMDYVKSLTFNTNIFEVSLKFDGFFHFKKDFETILQKNSPLLVYLSVIENNLIGKKEHERNIAMNEKFIEDVDSVFGKERIILKSSKIISNDKAKLAFKIYLVNAESFSKEKYEDKQKNVISILQQKSSIFKETYIINDLFRNMHMIELYREIFLDLFKGNNTRKFQNFIETNKKQDKISTLGFLKGVSQTKDGTGEIYTLFVPEINQIYGYKNKEAFKFKVKTTKYYLPNGTTKTSYLKRLNDTAPIEINILSQTKKIDNFTDKAAISFSQKEFKDYKYHLYCEILKTLEKSTFVKNVKTSVSGTCDIKETLNFYNNNINKDIVIGFVYEDNLKNDALKTLKLLENSITSEQLISKKVEIIPIPIVVNQSIDITIKTLENFNADAFICFTDIGDYKCFYDSQYILRNNQDIDYYNLVKSHSLFKIKNGEKAIITQGILSNNLRNIYQNIKDRNADEDGVIYDDKESQTDIKNKIKTTIQETLSKIIFSQESFKIEGMKDNGTYALVSFNAEKKLLSFIKIATQNNIVEVLERNITSTQESEHGSKFRDNDRVTSWLMDRLQKNNGYIKDILSQIKSYNQFLIYDYTYDNFLICTDEDTYILSDEDYDFRLELLDKKFDFVKQQRAIEIEKYEKRFSEINDEAIKDSGNGLSFPINNPPEQSILNNIYLKNPLENQKYIKEILDLIKEHKSLSRDSTLFMLPALPIYNLFKEIDLKSKNLQKQKEDQILFFEINNETYYFIPTSITKTLKYKQTHLTKVYFSENNSHLKDFYFSSTNNSIVRNGLHSKTTIWQKMSQCLIIN